MPLTAANLNAVLGWTLSTANTGFQNTGEGPDQVSFNLSGLNLTSFNQVFARQFTLTFGTGTTIDLYSFTNLVNEAVAFGHVLALIVLPVTGPITIAPGASNPLTWFLAGTTPTVTVTKNGLFVFSEPVTGPGHIVDATHRTLLFTNNDGASTTTLTVVALGGP